MELNLSLQHTVHQIVNEEFWLEISDLDCKLFSEWV